MGVSARHGHCVGISINQQARMHPPDAHLGGSFGWMQEILQ